MSGAVVTITNATTGVATAEITRSSCFPRYDAKILDQALKWRDRRYFKDGAAVAVCTSVTLVYSQR